jgi:tetratricopeptide (TPR) repeat protein
LEDAQEYPRNLGEGKLYGIPENDIHYWLGCVYERLDDNENAEFYWRKAVNGIAEPSAAVFYNDPQPDKIFYQGLALQKLGKLQEALNKFNDLIHYGTHHKNDEVMIDYFAVSLPDLMIFDDDLNKRNYVHCLYISALGFLGLEEFGKASALFEEILSIDAAHQGAAVHMNSFVINTVI